MLKNIFYQSIDNPEVLYLIIRDQVTVLDAADYERACMHNWHLSSPRKNGKRYVKTSLYDPRTGKKRNLLLHVHLMGLKGIDHKNGDGTDNTRANLRPCTHQENLFNTTPRAKSGFKGVSPHGKRWRAFIQSDKKYLYLGTFDDPISAAKAYNEAAIRLRGEFAYLNQIAS